MTQVIKGMNPTLQWLNDILAFFQAEIIKIPNTYRDRVIQTKKLLENDTSGLVNSMLDFAIKCAQVDYTIETDNDNLTKVLNEWLRTVNFSLRGKIPVGIKGLSKEYFRERWKGSSHLVLRTFWDNSGVNGARLRLPQQLFFVDGEDIVCRSRNSKTEAVLLGDEIYEIRINTNPEDNIRIPQNKKTEKIFVQKPYDSWGTYNPVPFVIRRGLYENLTFLAMLSGKGQHVVSNALEHLLILKKGTERMLLDGNIGYSEEDLRQAKQDLEGVIARKKSEQGQTTYATNFDTTMEHLIPEYARALNSGIYAPIEMHILAGLGLIDIVEGTASARREAILNPKPFIGEINQGVEDFTSLLEDIVYTVVEENKSTNRKWMGANIKVTASPVKQFVTKDTKEILRNLYDRGILSKQTAVEILGNMDYPTEVKRRKAEKKRGEDASMFPPVVQNVDSEETTGDKTGPEKKNFKQASKEPTVKKQRVASKKPNTGSKQ